MQRLIDRALADDEDALEMLNIGNVELAPATKVIDWKTLQADFKQVGVIYVAAKKLELGTLMRMTQKLLLYISWISRHQYNDKSFDKDVMLVEEEEVLEEMAYLCKDKPSVRLPKDVSSSESEDSNSELENPEPASKKRKRQESESESDSEQPDTDVKKKQIIENKQKKLSILILKLILKYLFLINMRRKVKGLLLRDKDRNIDYFLCKNQILQLGIECGK